MTSIRIHDLISEEARKTGAEGKRVFSSEDMTEKKKVLLVEDEEAIRVFIYEMLTSDGFEVSCYDNGQSALNRSKEECFDIVVTDFRMQGTDGVEVARLLRIRCPDAFLIGISGENKKRDFLAAGANAFLKKPFAPGHLFTIIKNIK